MGVTNDHHLVGFTNPFAKGSFDFMLLMEIFRRASRVGKANNMQIVPEIAIDKLGEAPTLIVDKIPLVSMKN